MNNPKDHDLVLSAGPYRTTYIGMEVVRKSTKKEWENYGEILKRVDEAKQWAIGDWLVDGKSHYGDGLYQQAAGVLGSEVRSLQELKQIADRFGITERTVNLSWSHHKEVAALKTLDKNKKGQLTRTDTHDMEKAQELLSRAEKGDGGKPWSVRDLRAAVGEHVRRQDEEIRLANEPERYSVILADPAWEYDFAQSDSRKIDNQYTPTSLDDMKRLQVPAASDSVLFMWATSPKLREAMELIEAWGFEYKTQAVWVKDKIGMGYYFRQRHELLLVATRGNLQLPDESKRPDSVINAPRTEHSEKPETVHELIESMYPKYKKLEMFARKKRAGWAAWGDEA